MPFVTGLAAIAAFGVLGPAPALGAIGAASGNAVRDQEWWLADLQVTQAWQKSDGAGITVAVLGTGVAAGHSDLAGNVITGPDYSGSGRVPGGSYWGVEGTAVAGVIAGHGDNGNWGDGIVGIAPEAKVLSIRVTLEFNDPLASDQVITRRLPDAIADGITYAVEHGARVIDLPLDPGTLGLTSSGDPAAAGGSGAERAAVAYALRKDVVLVGPAGDDGQGPGIENYPAAYPGVIAVGAIERSGNLASFSSRRFYTSLTAPGVNLVTAAPPDGYGGISSTSTASGVVAGVAALILSKFPHLTVAQVTRALVESTTATAGHGGLPPLPARSDAGYGYGTVDAARAIEMAALISSATQVRQPAAPASRPPQPAHRSVAAPRRPSAGTTAGSVLRDAVAGVGLLIVLLVVALLVVRSRRERGRGPATVRAHARGQHEHRRPEREPEPSLDPVGRAAAGYRSAGPGQSRSVKPVSPAADGWHSPAGWQGGGIGEISHSSNAPSRPAIAPMPRAAAGARTSRGGGAQGRAAGPPWEPAPEPEHAIGALPVASAGIRPPESGPSTRVPRDMAVAPGAATESSPPASVDLSTAPAGVDLSVPPAGFDLSTPAFGLTPPAFGVTPSGPDVPAPDGAEPPAGQSPGFAAAPVPADYAELPTAELAPDDDSVAARSADPSYIWDLAATDVFPAATDPGPPEPAGAADVPSAPEGRSGADGS